MMILCVAAYYLPSPLAGEGGERGAIASAIRVRGNGLSVKL